MNMHKTKRFFQLVALKSMRLMNAPQKANEHHSDYEKECIAVCKALMHKEDSTLLMSPISGKRYIKSHDEQLFIIIDQHQVTIVNHQYSYTIDIWGKALERINRNFVLWTTSLMMAVVSKNGSRPEIFTSASIVG